MLKFWVNILVLLIKKLDELTTLIIQIKNDLKTSDTASTYKGNSEA